MSILDTALLRLRQHEVERPPDWRWKRAQLIRERPRLAQALQSDQDEAMIEAARFLAARLDCRDENDLVHLQNRWPNLWGARALYGEASPTRHELDGMLLTREPLASVARICRLNEGLVEWYERIFFNVLDRRESESYVYNVVLGPLFHRGFRASDTEILWKFYGFHAGPVILKAIVAQGTRQPNTVENADEIKAWVRGDCRGSVDLKASIAIRTMPINSHTQEKLLEVHQRYIELETAALNASGGAQEDLAGNNVKQFFAGLSYLVGGDKPRLYIGGDPYQLSEAVDPVLLEMDAGSIEPRAHELLQLTMQAGQPEEKRKKGKKKDKKFPVKESVNEPAHPQSV